MILIDLKHGTFWSLKRKIINKNVTMKEIRYMCPRDLWSNISAPSSLNKETSDQIDT